MQLLISVKMHEPWHCGSGRGAGPSCDALVLRDQYGLPMIAGRTLKGLLKDGLRLAVQCRGENRELQASMDRIFGKAPSDSKVKNSQEEEGTTRFLTEPGQLFLKNALVGKTSDVREAWVSWAKSQPTDVYKRWFFMNISSTALDKTTGLAVSKSLRTIEYAIPVELWSQASFESDNKEDLENLKLAAKFVRELGLRRNRGFGRCTLSIEEVSS